MGRAAVLACVLAWASGGHAEPTPAHFRFDAAAGREPVVDELTAAAEGIYDDVSNQLGAGPSDEPPILVRVLFGEQAFQAAMPGGGVAEWAAGVAFPDHRLIVLRVDANTRFELRDVFRHEVAHIVLARAVRHAFLPLWIVEGLAVQQAGEHLADRWRKTLEASLVAGLPRLSALETSFPQATAQADLAYAQSASFVGFLLRRAGWPAIRSLVRRIHDGMPFAEAFTHTYGKPVATLEHEWRAIVESQASWWPVLTGTAALSVVLVALFILSVRVKRRRVRARLATLEAESGRDDEFA